jgi:hypothetical protein
MKFISENNSVKIREKISEKRAVPEMRTNLFFGPVKNLSLAQMA